MKLKKNILFLYMFPAYLIIGLTFIYPVFRLFQYAFFKTDKENNIIFLGFSSFKKLFSDNLFFLGLRNNFLMLAIIPVLLAISIFVAVLIYEGLFGWRTYRVIIFLPYILAIPVIGIVFSYMLYQNGIINLFLERIHLDFLALNWLGDKRLALVTVMAIIIWKEVGLGIVLFLARLMSVDEQLFEAADIDGANWFQRLFHITIPELAPVIEFYTIFSVITVFSWIFNYIFVMTAGGPGNATMVLELYIFNSFFRYGIRDVASAAAIILMAIVTIFIFLQFRVRKRQDEGETEK
jgi:ABC-type sugar transport system permease subunit